MNIRTVRLSTIDLFGDQIHRGSIIGLIKGRGIIVLLVFIVGSATGRTAHVVDDKESYHVIAVAAAVFYVIVVVILVRYARSDVIVHLSNQNTMYTLTYCWFV